MEENFKIRTYPFGELAQLYFPNITKQSASKQLKKWIDLNKYLGEHLFINGAKQRLRILTPAQVKMIVEQLGEP